MNFLLDTHTFLWFCFGDRHISSTARALIDDKANRPLLSMASLWEMAIKNSKGKLPLTKPFAVWIPDQLNQHGIELHRIELAHTAALTLMPFHHTDPFDRMIAAQALVDGLPLVSVDAAFDAYGVTRLW